MQFEQSSQPVRERMGESSCRPGRRETRLEAIVRLHAEERLSFKRGVVAQIEIGRHLAAAKEECGHGNWSEFAKQLPFGIRQAQRYLEVYRNSLTADETRPAWRDEASIDELLSVSGFQNVHGEAEDEHISDVEVIGDLTRAVDSLPDDPGTSEEGKL